MKAIAQQIAIAKACGWTIVSLYPLLGVVSGLRESPVLIPDYLNDLNAIREATAILPDLASDDNGADQLGYCEWLATVVGAKWGSSNAHDMWLIVNASAAERAEAFLRTIGKWRDDQ